MSSTENAIENWQLKNNRADVCVLGSHRNEWLPDIVTRLRQDGLTVWTPHEAGFSWPDAGIQVPPEKKLKVYVNEPRVGRSHRDAMQAMFGARLVLGVEPLGVTAALMLGYAMHEHYDKVYLYLTTGQLTRGSLMFCGTLVPPMVTLAKRLRAIIDQ